MGPARILPASVTRAGRTSTAPCGHVPMIVLVMACAMMAPATATVVMLAPIAPPVVLVPMARSALVTVNVRTALASAPPDGLAMTATHAHASMTALITDTATMEHVFATLATEERIALCPPLRCHASAPFAVSGAV